MKGRDFFSKEFKCEILDFSCKKSATLKKNMNSKHIEQRGKICTKD